MSNITISGFAALRVAPRLCELLQRRGIETPTPIQEQAIPVALEGRDLVGIAQTGTGKTLAFGIPMVERLLPGDLGLVLAPTRELAQQIAETYHLLGVSTVLLVGGASIDRQVYQLRGRYSVIVATPGRLIDHLNRRTARLNNVSIVVLDEADRMLDMGFAPAIKQILDQAPKERQTLLFSATMPPEISELSEQYLVDAERIQTAPAGTASDLVDQELIFATHEEKRPLLFDILHDNDGSVLIFTRTRHGARKLAKAVRGEGHSAAEIHADRTLAQRREALHGFKTGEFRILVATDIAARGIDVKDISLVVNFDVPENPDDYIHRIGRTGRAGSVGKAITLSLSQQARDVWDIENLLGMPIPISDKSTSVPKSVKTMIDKGERPGIGEGIADRRANNPAPIRPHVHSHAALPQEEFMKPKPKFEKRDRGPRPERPYRAENDRQAPRDRYEGDARRERQPREGNRDDRFARPQNDYRNDRQSQGDFGRSQDRGFRDDRRSNDSRPNDDRQREARPYNSRPYEKRQDDSRYNDRNDRPARPYNDDRRPGGFRDRNPQNRDEKPYGRRDDRPGPSYNDRGRDDRPRYDRNDRFDRDRNFQHDRNRNDRQDDRRRDDSRPYQGRNQYERRDDRSAPRPHEDRNRDGYRNDRGRDFNPKFDRRDSSRPARPTEYGDRNSKPRYDHASKPEFDRPRNDDRSKPKFERGGKPKFVRGETPQGGSERPRRDRSTDSKPWEKRSSDSNSVPNGGFRSVERPADRRSKPAFGPAKADKPKKRKPAFQEPAEPAARKGHRGWSGRGKPKKKGR